MSLLASCPLHRETCDGCLLDELKPLMSHDKLANCAAITDRDQKGQLRAKRVVFDGFPCFIFCTAKLGTAEEIANRAFLLSPEETQEKFHDSIDLIAEHEKDPNAHKLKVESDPQRIALKQHIRAVRDAPRVYVITPDELMDKLKTTFLARHPFLTARNQRDFPRLIGLVKAWTYLRRFQRQNTPDESLIAEQQDVTDAFRIYDELADSNELGLTPAIYGFYIEILKPLAPGPLERSVIQKQYREVYHKPLSLNKLQRAILPSLDAAGLIRLEPDPLDRRKQLVYVELIESDPVVQKNTTPPDYTISSIETPTRHLGPACFKEIEHISGVSVKGQLPSNESKCEVCQEAPATLVVDTESTTIGNHRLQTRPPMFSNHFQTQR